MVAEPSYMPTSNGFQLLHILVDTCYFFFKKIYSHPSGYEVVLDKIYMLFTT